MKTIQPNDLNTLYEARQQVGVLNDELARLRAENATLRAFKTKAEQEAKESAAAKPAPESAPRRAFLGKQDPGLEKRYWDRVHAAEKSVEEAKESVRTTASPQEQTLAMRALRLAEQKLELERRNFK